MQIKVSYLDPHLRDITGKESELLSLPSNSTIRDLLTYLSEKYGSKFRRLIFDDVYDKLRPYTLISVNGVKINSLNDADGKLGENSKVEISIFSLSEEDKILSLGAAAGI